MSKKCRLFVQSFIYLAEKCFLLHRYCIVTYRKTGNDEGMATAPVFSSNVETLVLAEGLLLFSCVDRLSQEFV